MPATIIRVVSLITISVATCFAAGSPAGAQEAGVQLELLNQPVWHEPDDELGLKLRLTNEGPASLDGFRLQIRLFRAATSRSDLEANFEVDPSRIEFDSTPLDLLDASVDAGSSRTITVREPVSVFEALAPVTEGGVYPLTVTVTDSQGLTALDTLTTQLLYFPSTVEVPLNVAFVWPLTDLPSRGSGGVFSVERSTDEIALEGALDQKGWLRGVLEALSSRSGGRLRIGLGPLPRMVDEIDDMADGYRRSTAGAERTVAPDGPSSQAARTVLDQLASLFGPGTIQPILVPYSYPDVPLLGDLSRTNAQLNDAEDVLEEVANSPGRAWVLPPGGRLDEPAFERLRSAGAAASTFVSQEALEPLSLGQVGCREDFAGISHTCPVALKNPVGNARALVLDAGLQQRFSALVDAPGDAAGLQRLFAEIAMIWAELPGVGDRVIALVAPPLWHPSPSTSMHFVRTMARAPWIRTVTPRKALHLGIGAREREVAATLPQLPEAPDEALLEDVEEAEAAVESFARLRPPAGLLQRLRRDVMVAHSRLWWGREPTMGTRFAQGARDEVQDQLSKISIGGRNDITLTSRRGPVPLVFVNGTDYDVTVDIHLASSNRDLQIVDPVISGTFKPGVTPLSIEAGAGSSGIFPVTVRVETPDGYTVHSSSISIRSTEFNEIALGVTVGALAFLVMFAVFRGVRGRSETAAGGPGTDIDIDPEG